MAETDGEMLQRLGADGAQWAEEFNKTAVTLGYPEMDEGWLIGWFANAIENTCVTRKCRIPDWRSMETAPKDGTRVLLWMVHTNAKYSKDPIGEGWEAAVVAEWIDHNGGGWTWHGLCGSPTAWMPMISDRPLLIDASEQTQPADNGETP
jgi:hypothetical protein